MNVAYRSMNLKLLCQIWALPSTPGLDFFFPSIPEMMIEQIFVGIGKTQLKLFGSDFKAPYTKVHENTQNATIFRNFTPILQFCLFRE